MPGGLRLLFDENFGRPIVRCFADLAGWDRRVEQVTHLFDIAGSGSADEHWIPLAAERGYVVVSCDVGRGKRSRRLPDICRLAGVTHVLIRGKLHHEKQFEKVRAILVVWPELMIARQVPPGSRFALQKGPVNPTLKGPLR
jgi:hypothetical protein